MLLCLVCRRQWLSDPVLRAVLAFALAAAEIERGLHDGLHFPDRMPLHLCNVSDWAAILALVTLWTPAVEFAYFVGFPGAALALLMPDMGSAWPFRFFLNHAGIIAAASVLVFARVGRIGRGAVWHSIVSLGSYMVIVGTFDWIYRTNYGFFCRKPEGVTLMNLMGPWPVYIAWLDLLAVGLVCLMWIPVRRSAA